MSTDRKANMKPTSQSLKRILNTLCMAIGAPPDPAQLNYLASSLSGFSESTLEEACRELAAIPNPYHKLPSEGEMGDMSRLIVARGRKRIPYCQDCAGENGMVYFDAHNNRLRGMALMIERANGDVYVQRCPCGGTDHDWAG